MTTIQTMNEQGARVLALRKELSAAERELAESVAKFKAEGGSTMELSGAVYGAVKWPLVESAAKRMQEGQQ